LNIKKSLYLTRLRITLITISLFLLEAYIRINKKGNLLQEIIIQDKYYIEIGILALMKFDEKSTVYNYR